MPGLIPEVKSLDGKASYIGLHNVDSINRTACNPVCRWMVMTRLINGDDASYFL